MPKAVIENKSSVSIHGVNPGESIKIDVDDHDVPKEQKWRRRLKDAKIDNCVVLKTTKTKKKKGD